MAVDYGNALPSSATNRRQRQQRLLTLISVLCEPRQTQRDPAVCRLIFDSRLNWASAPIDAESSWLYLTSQARTREVAGCLVLTAD